ncbi:MAG TPA: BolA family protein [Gammaproteobacteria bacterium]|jgi:BolA protein|nr:BolA family transcriptional regulator [Gammaproteobacteria bacterium]HJP39982.1 BolA family protein [Gammaproteobacteria bacterium]
MNEQLIEEIRARLSTALKPIDLEITDESHKHIGHAGAKSGKGHFHVRIISAQFHDLSQVRRHRLIYTAVGNLMDTDIHALSIAATSPDEA